MRLSSAVDPAIEQFRLWEKSEFDPVVIEKLKRRAVDREAERTRRNLCTLVSRAIVRFRKAERRAYEASQVERIQAEDRERVRLEAVASDPAYSDEERRLARIDLAAKLYGELRTKFSSSRITREELADDERAS